MRARSRPSDASAAWRQKRRWCGACAKNHVGSVNIAAAKCEGCHLKHPSFALGVRGRRRWCSACAKDHPGAVNTAAAKCEGCGLKYPSFARVHEGKRRWCGDCAKRLPGMVRVPGGRKPTRVRSTRQNVLVRPSSPGAPMPRSGALVPSSTCTQPAPTPAPKRGPLHRSVVKGPESNGDTEIEEPFAKAVR
eukprot:SAG31_NODE_4591_length_3107_cov_18.766955_1_plen_191_part_00